ncbi:hypothetical protein M426DRAFT_264278 [Hypoxylon sp. CI-4A]|nr:hypothetical protein M426DRAFT_264278 [Hypoxylon sp. CI-4A]
MLEPEQVVGKPIPRWTEIEDKILKKAVSEHGVSHWDDVARMIWTRKSPDECRARWAELVPILYDEMALQNSVQELQRQGRQRSQTAYASVSSPSALKHQNSSYFLPLPSPLLEQQYKEVYPNQPSKEQLPSTSISNKGAPTSHTEPSSPFASASASTSTFAIPPVPSTIKRPPRPPPLPPHEAITAPAALLSRTRSHTAPGLRPEVQQREWSAPHPLMPGRYRKSSAASSTKSLRGKQDQSTSPRDDV